MVAAEPITTHTPTPRSAEEVSSPVFGVFDEDKGDFVAAFICLRDADDAMADLERDEHDFGSRAWFPKYWPRYSTDTLPADHELGEQVRL